MAPLRPTCLTLFAGAGGADIGIQNAGFRHVRCIEYWEPAYATLKAAGFPAVLGDVRDLRLYRDLPHIDLMWASPPCQGFSGAGKGLGKDDPRNGWPWVWDAIDRLRLQSASPTWLIAENVRGMTFHKGACKGGKCCTGDCRSAYLDVVLREAQARFAWAEWRVLDAVDYGVPQFRKRVILVAGPCAIEWPEPTHFDPASGRRPWRTVRDVLCLEGHIDMERGSGMSERHGKRRNHPMSEPAPTLRSRKGGGGALAVMVTGVTDSLWLRTEMVGATSHPLHEPSSTVPTKGNQYLHQEDPGARKSRAGTEPWRLDRPAPTTGRRRLTPLECAALQDFPPDYPWQGTKTSHYRQIGNAVPPKLAEVVARQVLTQIAREKG